MKTCWLEKAGHDRVLVFFTGWGMDEQLGAHLLAKTPTDFGHDVLLCYDYRDLAIAQSVLDELADYEQRLVIAWSLGVWAAAHAGLEDVVQAIAVNGTLEPISDQHGIPIRIFQSTLDTYNEPNRKRFMRRICGGAAALNRFEVMASQRSVADQQQELAAIQGHVLSSPPVEAASWRYSHAIIGGKDMIFPCAAQQLAWQGVAQTVLPTMAHMPFFDFETWPEVLSCRS
ncbi:MAG: alpha/beta fold hydrolase [Desulfuromonas sp.]|nr:alpha/beta fold hydrolase [Desulfuromonas sp.]